jgi:restriction endonuclease
VQRISPNAIGAFKDALTASFWAKKDLLAWLRSAVPEEQLLSGIDWLGSTYKRDSVSRFVDRLASDQDRYGELLLRLMSDTADMDDFPQLAWIEDAEDRTQAARDAVARLKRYIEPYEAQLAQGEAARREIERNRRSAELRRATTEALEQLKVRFFELMAMDDAQSRGRLFESFLRELFDVFDLAPRGDFRIVGEQIDGGFTLDEFHYLLEAKWERQGASREQLDAFRAKVAEKADTTLGLFVAIEGFEPKALDKHNGRRSPLLLMDGGDLLAVLEQRIDLSDLLRAKRRHAAMTGEIYQSAGALLTSH